MTDLINDIYRTGVVHDSQGKENAIHSVIGQTEGEFLSGFIRQDESIKQVIEVGCGYGLSSLFISAALAPRQGRRHIILDPLQDELFQGIGLLNLRRSKLDFFEFHAEPSEYFLPKLAEAEPESFDLAFIDGFHTFDHTLIDLFYSSRLIRRGGFLMVDDCHHPSVSKAVAYFSKFPAYAVHSQSPGFDTPKGAAARMVRRLLPPGLAGYLISRNLYDRYYTRAMFARIVVLQKVGADERSWDWFVPF